MEDSITYISLDVHKDSISVAITEKGRDGEVKFYGAIGGDGDITSRSLRIYLNTEKT